jgi:hypothetical protein
MKKGYGKADYLFYLECRVVGVVEAKPEGVSLTAATAELDAARLSDRKPSSQHDVDVREREE